jgi:hypothetical protein
MSIHSMSKSLSDRLPRSCVVVRGVGDLERLQDAGALRELAGRAHVLPGDIAIQRCVNATILCLVQRSVEPHARLVREASRLLDWDGVYRPRCIRRNLEAIPVRLLTVLEDLLARHPTPPRHLAAGTVGGGSTENRRALDDLKILGHSNLGVARDRGRVVSFVGRNLNRNLIGTLTVLVVADQYDALVEARHSERGHAVEDSGRRVPIGHHVSLPGDDFVAEATRQ